MATASTHINTALLTASNFHAPSGSCSSSYFVLQRLTQHKDAIRITRSELLNSNSACEQPPPSAYFNSSAPSQVATTKRSINMTPYNRGHWQEDEHQRFLEGLKHYPSGPWTAISQLVVTRSPRQVQTHAQKYFEKIERHIRGLRRDRRPPPDMPFDANGNPNINRGHELDNDILIACRTALASGQRLPTPTRRRSEEERLAAAAEAAANASNQETHRFSPVHDTNDDISGDDDDDDSDEPTDLLPLDKSLDFLIELLSADLPPLI